MFDFESKAIRNRPAKSSMINRIVLSIPILVVWISIIFPGMSYRMDAGMFPTITTAIGIMRLDEILVYLIFLLWVIHVISLYVFDAHVKRRMKISEIVKFVCLLLAPALLAYILGRRKYPEFASTDLRLYLPVILFPGMFLWCFGNSTLETIETTRRWLFNALFVSSVIFLVSCLPGFDNLTYFDLWHRHNAHLGFTIILYAMALSESIIRGFTFKRIFAIIASTGVFITGIEKWWLLGILTATGVVVYASRKMKIAKSNPRIAKAGQRIVMVFGLLILFVLLSFSVFTQEVEYTWAHLVERVFRYDAGNDFSGGRFELWGAIVEDIKLHPLMGCGLGHRAEGILANEIELRGTRVEDHDFVLWFAVRMGIPIALLFVTLCVIVVRSGLQVLNRATKEYEVVYILTGLSIFVLIFVMALVGQWLFMYEISILFGWSCAMICSFALPRYKPVIQGSIQK